MRQSCADTLATEEPDELIAHVRVCGGAGWVTIGSTRKPTAPWAARGASTSSVARRLTAGVRPTAVWRWDMKAICLHARGGPEALAYEEVPQPHPGEGEVLVRVHAAGVIHTELFWVPTWTTRAGEPRPLPVIPGHEFSGEIAALGAGVRAVGVGDLVYGLNA